MTTYSFATWFALVNSLIDNQKAQTKEIERLNSIIDRMKSADFVKHQRHLEDKAEWAALAKR